MTDDDDTVLDNASVNSQDQGKVITFIMVEYPLIYIEVKRL